MTEGERLAKELHDALLGFARGTPQHEQTCARVKLWAGATCNCSLGPLHKAAKKALQAYAAQRPLL